MKVQDLFEEPDWQKWFLPKTLATPNVFRKMTKDPELLKRLPPDPPFMPLEDIKEMSADELDMSDFIFAPNVAAHYLGVTKDLELEKFDASGLCEKRRFLMQSFKLGRDVTPPNFRSRQIELGQICGVPAVRIRPTNGDNLEFYIRKPK